MRRAVGVAFERDRRHGDDGRLGQAALQRVVLRLAVAQADPPAVVVDHDRHVIRVVERGGAALERGVVEVPLRRGRPPDEPRELAPVALVPGPAALGREVVLVPPLPLGLRRQRQLAGLLTSDQIPAHRDEPGAPLAARAPRRRRPSALPSRRRRRPPSRSRGRPSTRRRRPPGPTAARCGTSRRRESASCRSRAGTGRSPGSPPPPAAARPRRRCGCRTASRAAERPRDRRRDRRRRSRRRERRPRSA